MLIIVYVDDIIIIGSSDLEVQQIISLLNRSFSLKNLGELNYFLGVEAPRTSDGILLSRNKYISNLLERAKISETKSLPKHQ